MYSRPMYRGRTLSPCGTYVSNITASDANDLGTWPDEGNVLGGGLGLLDVAAEDAGIGA